jgi:hypothetical protein
VFEQEKEVSEICMLPMVPLICYCSLDPMHIPAYICITCWPAQASYQACTEQQLCMDMICKRHHVYMALPQQLLFGSTAHLSIGLTAVVCCAAPGTVAAAGVMPVSIDSTS